MPLRATTTLSYTCRYTSSYLTDFHTLSNVGVATPDAVTVHADVD
jgi:hypothetical protein